jgi:hypothetical protein
VIFQGLAVVLQIEVGVAHLVVNDAHRLQQFQLFLFVCDLFSKEKIITYKRMLNNWQFRINSEYLLLLFAD